MYLLGVSLFFDLNGNETQDVGEPPVSGSTVRANELSCTTDADGKCEFGRVSPRDYQLRVGFTESPKDFNYFFANRDVIRLDDGLAVEVNGDTTVEIALGQGPLPLPMITQQGFGGIYSGFRTQANPTHDGLDLWVEGQEEQPILANISGVIESVGQDCNHITILVRDKDLQFNVGMGHLTRVVVEAGQRVRKGDVIGFVDPALYNGTRENPGTIEIACTTQPHVHYNLYGPGGVGFDGDWGWLDPTLFAPERGNPVPLFDTAEAAEEYSRK